MKSFVHLFVFALVTSLVASCGTVNRVSPNDNDDLYSVRPSNLPPNGNIDDDLSYSSYKYQQEEQNKNNNNNASNSNSSLGQTTVYSNTYNNFYGPSSYYNYNVGFRHPTYSFGLGFYNYGYNPYYGYPSYMSYGYNPYYGYGSYPSYMYGYGYPYYNPYRPYGYNPYYYGMGGGYSSFYGNGGYPYGGYGYDPYHYGYNNYGYGSPYGYNNYGYNSNSGYYGNSNTTPNGTASSTGIHYSGPRQNNSGGGIVTRKNPNSVGMAPIGQSSTATATTSTPVVSAIKANERITDKISASVKPEQAAVKETTRPTINSSVVNIKDDNSKNIIRDNYNVMNSNSSTVRTNTEKVNNAINNTIRPAQNSNINIQTQQGTRTVNSERKVYNSSPANNSYQQPTNQRVARPQQNDYNRSNNNQNSNQQYNIQSQERNYNSTRISSPERSYTSPSNNSVRSNGNSNSNSNSNSNYNNSSRSSGGNYRGGR